MALEATHTRFAIEFKDQLGVKNLGDYVAGCLYPDSRYETGIKRALTHPVDFLDWNPAQLDDFKKGWYTHLLCDKVQGMVFREKLPQLFIAGEVQSGNATWVGLTAIKILQDIKDSQAFNLVSFLPTGKNARAYNNEDFAVLKFFYQTICDFYSDPNKVSVQNYEKKLTTLGLEKEYAGRVVSQAQSFLLDEGIMATVETIFLETVVRAKEIINR